MPTLSNRIRLTLSLSFIAILLAVSWARAEGGAIVSDAWVRHVAPSMKVQAGYLMVSNKGATPIAVTGAESAAFEKIELHTSRIENGIAIMEAVKRIEVPAVGTVQFQPGGLHLMLIGPKHGKGPGGKIPISLVLETGDKLEFEAEIRKSAARGSHHGHGMTKTN